MKSLLFTLVGITFYANAYAQEYPLQGAWTQSGDHERVLIITKEHFALTQFASDPAGFDYTCGGTWSAGSGEMVVTYEFYSNAPDKVGTTETWNLNTPNGTLILDGSSWVAAEGDQAGALEGAWLITERQRNGIMQNIPPSARKTMKILSGTYFQWIAYNTDTGDFSGTGGGTYTTEGNTYTENILWFSRDANRVGASLNFTYFLRHGRWHHSGNSSRGEPIYEIWEKRSELGY